jgi:hypothetical protein
MKKHFKMGGRRLAAVESVQDHVADVHKRMTDHHSAAREFRASFRARMKKHFKMGGRRLAAHF